MFYNFTKLDIPDVLFIEPKKFSDDRGYFVELYKDSIFKEHISLSFKQEALSVSQKGVIRALHYQLPPKAQGKLVSVIKGSIIDVAVDIRKSSPTFGKWVSKKLDDKDHAALYIPPGFAHGFAALEDDCRIIYRMTDEYAPELERGIIWNDPSLNIQWTFKDPILAPKDGLFPNFENAEVFE